MNDEELSIQRLEVKFDSTTAIRHKKLYANGRMQVRVLVLICGGDAAANEVSLHGHPALQTLRLIAYNGAQPLAGPWEVSTQENRYAHDMAGGIARTTELVPAAHNRISDPTEKVQVFEFWVSSKTPGSLQIAAQITIGGNVVRSNGLEGLDSSVTLEAVSPIQYPVGHFKLAKGEPRVIDRFDSLHVYSLGLYAEGRSIHLLDWSSAEVTIDDGYAALFFYSGNISASHPGVRTYYGYIVPVYGTRATVRGPKGYMSAQVNQQPGTISLLNYISPDHSGLPVRNQTFEMTVFDEYGTSHWLRVRPDLSSRSFVLE